MRKVQFAEGEYYHIFNRGVERRKIFCSKSDYRRFLFDLYACNDVQSLDNVARGYRGLASVKMFDTKRKHRKPFVSILCFCLMPNHFHLLLRQHRENGVPRFMQKLSTAYTMYFNTKHDRVGALFQGTYRAVHIKDEDYLTHLSRYIHLNPLELHSPQWKKRGVRSPLKAKAFLQEYPWSSYADYLGYNIYPTILDRDLLREIVGKTTQYKNFTEEWADLQGLEEISPLVTEA